MDLTLFVVYVVAIGYLGITMYVANVEQLNWDRVGGRARSLLFVAPGLVGFLGLYAVLIAVSASRLNEMQDATTNSTPIPEISGAALFGIIFLAAIIPFFSIRVIVSKDMRERLKSLIPGEYSPYSIVHTTAIVLCLMFFAVNTILFLVEGGTEGMAENIDTNGVSAGMTIFQAILWVMAAFLGVGYAIRREMPQTLQRLGLRIPTRDDFVWSFLTVIVIFVALMIFSMILSLFISSDELTDQSRAAESVVNAFSTIPLAVIMASSAAIGEEIFFRGALQPIFGLVPTSIFFAMIHTQVLLTPQIVGIIIVGLAFGWLRKNHSTTAAILAHFLYNFTIVMLNILVLSSGAG